MTKRKYSDNPDHNEVINKLYESIRQLKNQNRQLHLALGAQKIDCTWEEFVKDIKRKNSTIAAILELAHLRRFENGRIWLAFRDLTSEQRAIIVFQLKDFLRLWSAGKFGQPFTIKIKIAE